MYIVGRYQAIDDGITPLVSKFYMISSTTYVVGWLNRNNLIWTNESLNGKYKKY